jgi:hypothetical protein
LNQGEKLEMQKNAVSVVCVSEVVYQGQGEIRKKKNTVSSSRGERTERGIAILVHKSIVRSVVQKNVCNDRITALKLKAELVCSLLMQTHMPTLSTKMTKWKNFMI